MTRASVWAEMIISDASEILRKHGDVARQFVTASLHAFGAQSTPDLLFTPREGPFAGWLVFVEFVGGAPNAVADSSWLQFAVACRNQIVHANPNAQMRFVVATRSAMSESQREWASEHQIEFISEVSNGAQVASSILRIVRIDPGQGGEGMSLVYVRQPPGLPYISAGSRAISFPKSLPSPAVIPILAMPFNKDVTEAWQDVFKELVYSQAAVDRAMQRGSGDAIYYTITLSDAQSQAVVEFYI